MTKEVRTWAWIGFFVPLIWGMMELMIVNAQGPLAKALWTAVYITCPPWLLSAVPGSILIMPVLNALLYGGIVFMIQRIRTRSRAA